MSTLQETSALETVISAGQPVVTGLPAPPRTRHEEAFIAAGRAAVVLIPVLAVLHMSRSSSVGLLEAVALPAIWFLALRGTLDAAWLSPRVLGVPTACVLGTVTGLASVTLFEFWMPGTELKSKALLTMAAGILVASSAFETLAPRTLPRFSTVLIVGASHGGAELLNELLRRPELPFRCLGVVCDKRDADRVPNTLALGKWSQLTDVVRSQRPDIVVLARLDRHNSAVSKLVDSPPTRFRLLGIPEFYEQAFGRVPIEHLSPTWFTSVHLGQSWYSRATKRLLDIVLALVGLLIVAPLFPPIVWLVFHSGPGPVLFRQRRLGEGGRTFEILKFRTMKDGAEQPGQPRWAEQHDLRVTPVGRVLRRTRLDELPQLWNVLRGDMSIVGPRPERPEFLELLRAEVPYWTQRHLIKPGITGWAQIRRGYTSDVVGTVDKLSHDLYYLKHRSLVLDLAIIVNTAGTILSGDGAH